MGLRDRADIEVLLKLAAGQRQRLRGLETSLGELIRRIARLHHAPPDDEPDPKIGQSHKSLPQKMRRDVTTPRDATASRPHCPKCPSGYGDARVVHLTGQGRTVTYVCDECLHEWDVADNPKSHKP
jgi:hypothetical protein